MIYFNLIKNHLYYFIFKFNLLIDFFPTIIQTLHNQFNFLKPVTINNQYAIIIILPDVINLNDNHLDDYI